MCNVDSYIYIQKFSRLGAYLSQKMTPKYFINLAIAEKKRIEGSTLHWLREQNLNVKDLYFSKCDEF